jgi:putative flippase GtrA
MRNGKKTKTKTKVKTPRDDKDNQTRSFLAKLIVICAMTLVITTAVSMLITGDASDSRSLEQILISLMSLVLGYYFSKAS